jgi:hypothetical protein
VSWHQTLSSIERKTDLPQDRPRRLTDTARREAGLKVIGTWNCWCGRERLHGWTGKDAGEPHPRREATA